MKIQSFSVNNQQSTISNQSAFTLIELLVVIMLMGVLAAFSIVQTMTYHKQQVLQDATEQLVSDLKVMQGKAASGVQDDASGTIEAFFVSSIGGNTYTLNRRFASGSNSIGTQTLKSPVAISSWPGDIVFLVPTGKLEGGDKNIIVSYTGVGTHCIKVESSGRIYKKDRNEPC